MKKNRRVFVYTEDAPVHPDVVALGMNRAGPPILKSILDLIAGIAIYPVARRFDDGELDKELRPLCTTLPRTPTFLCKVLRRFPSLDFGISDTLPPQMLAQVVRMSNADLLFVPVGADHRTLLRAQKLAALAGIPYAAYLVDDFIAALRIAGAKQEALRSAMERSRIALGEAAHVLTITKGLGDYVRSSFGVSPTTMGLVIDPEHQPAPSAKNQIIFVGSVNFLYSAGLRELFTVVERIRQAGGIELTVRLTVPTPAAVKEFGELPPFVVSAPTATSAELADELASSLFAFLPYSFDSREKPMVTTSFPSKSLEYLAYARSIVVYGPDYGVATRVFREHGLPLVATSATELESALRSHLKARPEHSSAYREYLATAHSPSAARRTLCDTMGLGAG